MLKWLKKIWIFYATFKFNKMPEETNTASQVEQPRASEAPDWSLLQDLSNNQEVKIDNQNQREM